MNDYLSNLTDRSYERIPVLQPRLASRFETLPTTGALGALQPVEPLLPAPLADATEVDMTIASLPMSPSRAATLPVVLPIPKVTEAPQPSATESLTPSIEPLTANPRKPAPPKHKIGAPAMDELLSPVQPTSRRPAHQQPNTEEIQVARTTPVLAPPVAYANRPEPQRPVATRRSTDETTPTKIEAVDTIERIIERSDHAQPDAAATGAVPNPPAAPATRHAPQALPKPGPPNPGIVAQPTVIVAPPTVLASAEPPRRAESSVVTPTIQVTIGRVEVRATPASALAAKPTTAPSKTLSLEEYLQRRNEGGKR